MPRWITTRPHRRNPHINNGLTRLLDHCPERRQAHGLVRRLLDNRDATPLLGWLNDPADSGLAPLVRLAGALREDRRAVAQGNTTPYNSGVDEGRITHVELQKRLKERKTVRDAMLAGLSLEVDTERHLNGLAKALDAARKQMADI